MYVNMNALPNPLVTSPVTLPRIVNVFLGPNFHKKMWQ